jgi:hypothetical protein
MGFRLRTVVLSIFLCFLNLICSAQIANVLPSGLSGNVEIDAQTYKKDSIIGAPAVPEKLNSNAFLNLLYNSGPISAGLRYESYDDALQGYDPRYNGNGIMYRYVEFVKDELTVTAGSFYEQFGSGMILRSYFQPGLGIDNAFDGFRVKYRKNGISLKAFVAKQREYWTNGPGIVRGIDAEVNLNELIPMWANSKNIVVLGSSFVSKYQAADDPTYNLPENVGAFAARMNIHREGFNLYSEYAYKANDPSLENGFIYKDGQSLLVTGGYSKKGFGITLTGKRLDNMDFRSDRNATLNDVNINYLPAISEQYTYRLDNIYPYATQDLGEMGASAQMYYTFQSGTKIGGQYGTYISLEACQVNSIQTDPTNSPIGYNSNFFAVGNTIYYSDVNVEISKKFSKKFKATLNYLYEQYNMAVVQGHPDTPMVYAHIVVADMQYKLNSKRTVRWELQHLYTKEDRGNWAFALVEYSIAPGWSFNAIDMYNYGNPTPSQQLHYPSVGLAYVKSTSRISIGYGKQVAGLLCVGGVCRYVPASDGISLSLTSSF